jgi:hypothetical protein
MDFLTKTIQSVKSAFLFIDPAGNNFNFRDSWNIQIKPKSKWDSWNIIDEKTHLSNNPPSFASIRHLPSSCPYTHTNEGLHEKQPYTTLL